MFLSRVLFKNFRGLRELDVHCDHRLTIFAGINGAGKSSVLDAMSLMLSWPMRRIINPRGQGQTLGLGRTGKERDDITSGEGSGSIEATLNDGEQTYTWKHVAHRQGISPEQSSDYHQLKSFIQPILEQIEIEKNACAIPLFVHYSVNRAVLDIPLRVREPHVFDVLSAYDDALDSGVNFRHFFEWFRNREDLENELLRIPSGNKRDPQLEAVRKALAAFLPEYTNLMIWRNPQRMVVSKDGVELRLDTLSDGEKCLIAMIGDLARRLAMANPKMHNPLAGKGIVLIDEIELHLHPSWQRMVVNQLLETFPNVQFLMSTHSPLVLGEVEPSSVRLLRRDEQGQIDCYQPHQSYGLTTDAIIDELMRPVGFSDSLSRNHKISRALDQVFESIDEDEVRAPIVQSGSVGA